MAIEKWELSHAPSGQDLGRFKVRLRASADELQKLMQTLPAVCEQPFSTLSQDYDWALFVHVTSESQKNQLIQILKNLSPNGELVNLSADFMQDSPNLPTSLNTQENNSIQEIQLNSLPLNPDFSFEEFEISSENRFVHAAATAISESPGSIYNPFFVYGPPGAGKTHMLQAIALRILEQNPQTRILYISAETFKEKTENAAQTQRTELLRQTFEGVDLVLIEDIGVLSGQPDSQKELLHLLSAFLHDAKQVVISSNCPPRMLVNFDEKLKFRIETGLAVELKSSHPQTAPEILSVSSPPSIVLAPTIKLDKSDKPELQITGTGSFPPLAAGIKMPVSEHKQEKAGGEAVIAGDSLRAKGSAEQKVDQPPVEKKIEPDIPVVAVKAGCFYPKANQTEWNNTKEKLIATIQKRRLKFSLTMTELPYDSESDLKFSFFSDTCKTQEFPMAIVLGDLPGNSLEKKGFFVGLEKHMESEKIPLYFISWSDKTKDQVFLGFALDISLNLKGRK